MRTLGIETSCDETAFAVVKDGRAVLSSVVLSSLKEHRPYGGVVPEIASRSHLEGLLTVLERALQRAGCSPSQLDLIAVTQGPGLMGSLLVGLSAAKALAAALGKPLVGVDHVVAHLYAGFLAEPGFRFPFIGAAVSGGHTMLLRVDGPSRFRILGRTLDDAAGEAFDKVAKILGLGYPGGPEIERLSRRSSPGRFGFTRPLLSERSLDFSFSGIKTAVVYAVEKLKRQGEWSLSAKRDLCADFQEAVCEVLVTKALRAARSEGLERLVVGGGVAANGRLRRLFVQRCRQSGVHPVFPDASLCRDNAAMIAALGTALYREGRRDSLALEAYSDFLQHYGVSHSRALAVRRKEKLERWKSNPKSIKNI